MARLLGYMANRPDGLERALEAEADLLEPPEREEEVRPDAWGVGFYQGGEVLHKKRPFLSGEAVSFAAMAEGVRSECALLHMRQATVGDYRKENTHPFRMRRWTFAHDGTVRGFEHVRERLLLSLPDFLRRNVRGTTDSELVFHVLLSFLHDAGQIDPPEPDEGRVIAAIRSTAALLSRYAEEVGAPAPSLNLMLTEGRKMWALRRGRPLFFLDRSVDRSVAEGSSRSPNALRYVLIASLGHEGPKRGVGAVEEGSVLLVDRDLHTRLFPA